ncbi:MULTISPECIES: glycosyltransferase family 4 protein [unclassified Microbacterium]|uniref:glycosyltransferase family 4 protein n=1 Tax=unclassified Microbacterium TaxID=2609290 RepID=UPI003865F68C
MRVAYICVDPGVPVFGTKGASVHVQEIVRAFRARGDEVTIYCTRAGTDVPPDLADVPVVERRVRAGDTASREVAIARAARELAAEAAASDFVYERFSLFSDASARVSAPAVVEVNAPLIDEQRTHRELVDERGADAAARRVLAAADVVACVSEPVAAWAEEHGARRALVAPNGVNTARIRPSDRAARRPADRPLEVGFVGTLKPWHGVEVLIDAMALLPAAVARLVVIGDGPEAPALRERAVRLGVPVDFRGAVAPAAMPAALAGLDVGVAPYPADGDAYFSPLKVYEYLAAGLPVIASEVGQLPAAVTHAMTGLLVPAGSAPALAAAIAELASAPVARRRMAQAARDAAVTRHDWSIVLASILNESPRARRDQDEVAA